MTVTSTTYRIRRRFKTRSNWLKQTHLTCGNMLFQHTTKMKWLLATITQRWITCSDQLRDKPYPEERWCCYSHISHLAWCLQVCDLTFSLSANQTKSLKSAISCGKYTDTETTRQSCPKWDSNYHFTTKNSTVCLKMPQSKHNVNLHGKKKTNMLLLRSR